MSLFCNDTATTEIYTLSLRYALTIRVRWWPSDQPRQPACAVYPPKVQELGCANGQVEPGSGADVPAAGIREGGSRSEEHTSELQSRQYLVCRLLLEKKNKTSSLIFSYQLYTTS